MFIKVTMYNETSKVVFYDDYYHYDFWRRHCMSEIGLRNIEGFTIVYEG